MSFYTDNVYAALGGHFGFTGEEPNNHFQKSEKPFEEGEVEDAEAEDAEVEDAEAGEAEGPLHVMQQF